MKAENMTDMAKEKHAEFLLKFSSNLFTAFFITIIIGPLSLILSQAISPETTTALTLYKFLQALSGWQGIIFIIFELIAFYLAITTQKRAYEIYNSLYPEKIDDR